MVTSKDPQDYRNSHLKSGQLYDSNLAGSPFDHYMAVWEGKYIAKIVSDLFPSGIERYLDFACGTGRITEKIVQFARQSTAVDISPSMLAEARVKCPNTEFYLGDITVDDPELGQFDLISSFRFFGNAQDELRQAALSSIYKRLAPGGKLLINSHRNPRAIYALLDRVTGGNAGGMDLHLGKLRRLLAMHQMKITRLQPIGVRLYRAGLMEACLPNSLLSISNESKFGSKYFAAFSPDLIIVAEKC